MKEDKKVVTTEQKPSDGIQLRLNGGKPEMDAATIPIQWFFSPEVAAQKPTHLVFFEQNAKQTKDDMDGTWGYRYTCKVSAGVEFMELFSPGVHRMAVIALAGNHAEDGIQKFMERKRYCNYQRSICFSDIENQLFVDSYSNKYELNNAVVAATTVEFSIPEGLFAPPPPAWKKKWVNLFFERDAEDQCQFRKRAWFFAYHIQVILMLIWYAFSYGVIGTIASLYVIVASFFVWFFGFQTKNIFWMIWQAFRLESLYVSVSDSSSDIVVVMCSHYKQKYPKQKDGRYSYTRVNKKTTPIETLGWTLLTLLIIAFIYISTVGEINFLEWILKLPGVIIFGSVIVYFIIMGLYKFFTSDFMKKHRAEAKKREEEKQRALEQKYQKWLEKNLSFANLPKKVDLNNIPKPLKKTERTIQKFRISFWSTKIKVCRPFSQ